MNVSPCNWAGFQADPALLFFTLLILLEIIHYMLQYLEITKGKDRSNE
jgi:hypothetical protein